MFPDRLICDDSLDATLDGFRVKIRVNWYRGVALSCVEKVEVSIDGRPVATENMTIRLNGADHSFTELSELIDEFWFVADPAVVTVHEPGLVLLGKQHDVEVLLSIRLPYIIVGERDLLVSTDRCKKTLTAK